MKLGDGKLPSVQSKGTISVMTKSGNSKLIADVLYVSGLTRDLLNVGLLI